MQVKEEKADKYEVVVGLEVHAQLSTSSKIFCSDSTQFGAEPNTQVSPLSLGLPGSLPMLNSEVLQSAVNMGLATHCSINNFSYFARKNYFYPDLPKGYQITQSELPICYDGYLNIRLKSGREKKIGIERIHMEEDAGKNIHDQNPIESLVDLNRAGVPLVEIVSAPDIAGKEEAHAYLLEIRKLLRYLGISDGNMEEGSMRCDANISIKKKGENVLNNRCEVKNLNSFKNVQKSIEFEFKRQVELVEKGIYIEQNTLHFDLVSGSTSPTRSKEMANDYRYFADPDLVPIVLEESEISKIRDTMPILPEELTNKLMTEYGLNQYDTEQIINDRGTAEYFLQLCQYTSNYKAAANWIMGPIRSYLNDNALKSIKQFKVKPEQITQLIQLIDKGLTSFTNASFKIFPELVKYPEKSPQKIAEEKNLLIEKKDDNEIIEEIDIIIDSLPQKVEEYLNGKKGLQGLFMGKLMAKFKGKLNPKEANELLIKSLEKRKK